MESENSIQMSRPKTQRRLNLESSQKLPHLNNIRSSSFDMAMSPMTNLVHNLSGASLDSTPKRRFLSHDNLDADVETIVGSKGSLALSSGELLGSLREKENSFTSIRSFAAAGSPEKTKSSEDFPSRRSPRRLPLSRLDVNSPIKSRVDISSPIKTSFAKPAQPVSSGIPSTRLPSIEDVDSQDSGCFPEDSKYFKYPEPLYHRRMSDRNTSPASTRSNSSSLSAGGSQKYDGPAKLDFSFMSNGDDEGIPDELYEEEDLGLPTSVSLSQLIATPLSERATLQFSHEDSSSPPAFTITKSHVDESAIHNDFLCVPKEAALVEKFSRPSFRRSQSMFDHATPNARARNICHDSPMNQSPVARGLFVQDEDTGSSPLAPLGLHALRLRMKPSRVIQPVGGPPFKRSEPSSSVDSAVQQQENKRRKDDNDDRPVFTSLDHNVGNKTVAVSRLPHRIQRCHSETEATIMRALQRSTEEPDLIGDFTRPFALPLTAGKHQDLKCITPQTLVDLISGKFQDHVEKYTIIDCRYPYEYENGHINDAVNLWTKDMVWSVFMEGRRQQAPSTTHDQEKKRDVLIFHCEFSSERGPALSRYLRNKDRDDNKDNYPALHWPEVYLLHGGYKAFYEQFDQMCEPRSYLPMNQQGHEEDLRRCRAKTKSCNGEGKSGRPLTKSTSRRLELL